jgi:iron complex transport system substrate-binding protein
MTPLSARIVRRAIAPIGILAAITVSACGSTEDPDSSTTSNDGDEATSATEDDAETGADTGPITITDARGKEVVLEDGPAKNVVALEWMEAENLVTLGVMPTGVADVDGYSTWVTAAELDDTVTDVGTRAEPSIDAIVSLEPDLIIMEDERAVTGEQLEEYAPVIVLKGSDTGDNLAHMRATFTTIAEAVGKSDEAAAVLEEFDASLADGAAALEDAGASGREFMMVDGWTEGGTVNIRTFGKGSLFSDLAEALGLSNTWDGEVDPEWGLGQTDVEGMSDLGDVEFFYHAAGEDDWPAALADNAIWESLPFVQNDQLHALQPGTWTFGGPASSMQFIDQVVETLGS